MQTTHLHITFCEVCWFNLRFWGEWIHVQGSQISKYYLPYLGSKFISFRVDPFSKGTCASPTGQRKYWWILIEKYIRVDQNESEIYLSTNWTSWPKWERNWLKYVPKPKRTTQTFLQNWQKTYQVYWPVKRKSQLKQTTILIFFIIIIFISQQVLTFHVNRLTRLIFSEKKINKNFRMLFLLGVSRVKSSWRLCQKKKKKKKKSVMLWQCLDEDWKRVVFIVPPPPYCRLTPV